MKKEMTFLQSILIVGLFVGFFMTVLSLPLCISIAADFMAPEHSCSTHTPEDCP
jgi:hypothetical protein